MVSTDWRKDASSVSVLGDAAHNTIVPAHEAAKLSDNALVIETGVPVSSIDYRRLNKDMTPWGAVSSAPPAKTEFTTEETTDITQIRVNGLSPIVVVDHDGREITLPTAFALDVTPVERAYISSGSSSPLSLGELKLAKNPARLRRSSQDTDIEDTRRVLNIRDIRRSISTSPEYLAKNAGTRYDRMIKEKHAAALMEEDPAIDRIGGVEAESPHRARKVDQAARDRFRLMLERLNQLASATSSDLTKGHNEDQSPVTTLLANDPAIIAIRAKDCDLASNVAENGEEVDAMYQQQVGWQHAIGARVSGDSGYVSTEGTHKRHDSSGDEKSPNSKRDSGIASESPSKKLNPLAAEFKTVDKAGPVRFSMDKFDPCVPPPSFGPVPELSPPFSNYGPANGSGHFALAPPPGLGPMMPPMAPSPPMAHMNNFHAPVAPPMPFNNFGMFSPGPMGPIASPPMFNSNPFNANPRGCPPMPFMPQPQALPIGPPPGFNKPNMPIAPPLGFNMAPQLPPVVPHYRPAAMGPAPPMMQPPMFPAPAPMGIATPPIPLAPATFPVTKKPRGHDPIKQQQYEAYLEYRKAFEPGYHFAARARQANRYARQQGHQRHQAGA